MKKEEKPWNKFTIENLRQVLSEIPDKYNDRKIILGRENEPFFKAKYAGMIKETERFLNQNDGDECFFIMGY